MRKKPLGLVIVVLFLGAIFGSLIGELIGLVLPAGVVKQFFLRSVEPHVGPFDIDVRLFRITLGFALRLNVAGLFGIGIAAYILRWYT